ncbi:MAG: SDR family oxidoreductase [Defluviicoccus sp.]
MDETLMDEAQTKPPQVQERQPGIEAEMHPEPKFKPRFKGSDRLTGKTAIITGGDSGIGEAVAVLFAREGADVAIVYLNEHEDARNAARRVADEGGECLTIAGDIGDEAFCRKAVAEVVDRFGKVDILVNNAAVQQPQDDITAIGAEQLERTFRTNVFGYFYITQAALAHMPQGGAIVNTTSVTAYRGSKDLLDYSATRGAIVAFTRALAQSLVERKIRVNGVAPGPIWTPLIPSTFDEDRVASHGRKVPMERVGEPNEVAPCHLFLACEDSSYMTGQVLHPNGGEIVGG